MIFREKEVTQVAGIEFFSNTPKELEQMLNDEGYPKTHNSPKSGRAYRGNHRTSTHLKGLKAQQLADVYKNIGLA